VQYAHVGNNFILDFHEDALADVQPRSSSITGLNLRSASQSVNIRPVNSLNFNANYFLPATWAATTRSSSAATGARLQRIHRTRRRLRDGALPDAGGFDDQHCATASARAAARRSRATATAPTA
jgi:hypothetical protein